MNITLSLSLSSSPRLSPFLVFPRYILFKVKSIVSPRYLGYSFVLVCHLLISPLALYRACIFWLIAMGSRHTHAYVVSFIEYMCVLLDSIPITEWYRSGAWYHNDTQFRFFCSKPRQSLDSGEQNFIELIDKSTHFTFVQAFDRATLWLESITHINSVFHSSSSHSYVIAF